MLDAVGIPSRAYHDQGWWYLEVANQHVDQAVAELREYQQEDPETPSVSQERPLKDDHAVPGVVVYLLILVSIAVLEAHEAYGLDWLDVGRMHAADVRAGEWWRTVTALTLHVDLGHLMSNLVFGVLFGIMSGRTLGAGVAWLSIVVGGAIGNAVNAWIQEPDHSSIGASTAVFSALGLLVAHALRHWGDRSNRWKRWRPLIGGVVLLGFIGIGGERTDVGAHFTGFFTGMVIGWICSFLGPKTLSNGRTQWVTGVTAVAIILVAWLLAAR